jgi:hypothetical protein
MAPTKPPPCESCGRQYSRKYYASNHKCRTTSEKTRSQRDDERRKMKLRCHLTVNGVKIVLKRKSGEDWSCPNRCGGTFSRDDHVTRHLIERCPRRLELSNGIHTCQNTLLEFKKRWEKASGLQTPHHRSGKAIIDKLIKSDISVERPHTNEDECYSFAEKPDFSHIMKDLEQNQWELIDGVSGTSRAVKDENMKLEVFLDLLEKIESGEYNGRKDLFFSAFNVTMSPDGLRSCGPKPPPSEFLTKRGSPIFGTNRFRCPDYTTVVSCEGAYTGLHSDYVLLSQFVRLIGKETDCMKLILMYDPNENNWEIMQTRHRGDSNADWLKGKAVVIFYNSKILKISRA